MEIRTAKIQDADAIHAISKSLDYRDTTDSIARERLANVLQSPFDSVVVAITNNVIVGWVHLFIANRVASPSFVEIGGLAVHPDYRKQGIGKRLVIESKKSLNNNLPLRVRCHSLREDAHKFYAALGFIKVKEQYVFEESKQH